MSRKTPVRHVVRSHMRKRKNGQSYAHVTAYARGSGARMKQYKGTPAYLSEKPTQTEVLRAGYGVGARVELVRPQTGWNGQKMDEKFAHPIGSTGTVVGHFHPGEVVVQWDSDPKREGSSGQVVEAKKLRVVGKPSAKKEIIASISYNRVKDYTGKYSSDQIYEDGNKITLVRTEPVFDDVGYEVGDAEYQLIGTRHGDRVDFDTPKLVQSGVPRSRRWVIRNYFESQSPKDLFGSLFEEK